MNKANTKLGVILTLSIIAILISVYVIAKPNTTLVSANNDKSGNGVVVPAHAVEVAPNVFSLGKARDVDGRVVEGFMFINKRENHANPNAVCGDGICHGSEKKSCEADCGSGNGGGDPISSCFSVLAKGASWKTTEQYNVGAGIDAATTQASLDEWNDESTFNIFDIRNSSILVDGRDEVAPDGKNEVDFDDLGTGGTVAVTITWGIFRGNPANRELVEWDTSFNNNSFTFGVFDNTTELMDYENIAVHEFGHSLGLGHPDDSCTDESMYRFVDFNETKKRDLEAGDQAGVDELYG